MRRKMYIAILEQYFTAGKGTDSNSQGIDLCQKFELTAKEFVYSIPFLRVLFVTVFYFSFFRLPQFLTLAEVFVRG